MRIILIESCESVGKKLAQQQKGLHLIILKCILKRGSNIMSQFYALLNSKHTNCIKLQFFTII
jgi:hypothetical protein